MEPNGSQPNDKLPRGFPEGWDPTDAIERLRDESLIMDGGDHKATATRVFLEAAPIAALSIVNLAQHASSETVRLNAARYVADRTLGSPTQAIKDESNVEDAYDVFLRKIVEAVEGQNTTGQASAGATNASVGQTSPVKD